MSNVLDKKLTVLRSVSERLPQQVREKLERKYHAALTQLNGVTNGYPGSEAEDGSLYPEPGGLASGHGKVANN